MSLASRSVLHRLHREPSWLVIFDNAETVDHVRDWVPGGAGHVIITSRSGRTGGIAVPVGVSVFGRAESVRLLRTP